jgi:hypothetical protein
VRHWRSVRPSLATSGIGQVERLKDLLGGLAAGGGAGGGVDRADLLVDVPGDLDLAVRVAGREPLVQSCALPVGEVLNTGEQGPPDPTERVVLVAAPAEGALLDATSDLVECVARESDDVERIEDCDHFGQLVTDRVAIPAEPGPVQSQLGVFS